MNAPSNSDGPDRESAELISFGMMEPVEWAAELGLKLELATRQLCVARARAVEEGGDINGSADPAATAEVRKAVTQYLGELYVMLQAMPMLQHQPHILDALHFIITSLMDIDRGTAPPWLAAKASKRHLKRLEMEAVWVPVITALELHLLIMDKPSIDGAAKLVAKVTGQRPGTIKDWHSRLFQYPDAIRAEARRAIKAEIDQVCALVSAAPPSRRHAVVSSRITQLLS